VERTEQIWVWKRGGGKRAEIGMLGVGERREGEVLSPAETD